MLCSKHSIQETSQSAQSWKQFTSRFLMVCLTLIAAFSMQLQEANAQNIIKDFLKDNQVTIDPNKGLQITPKVICPAPLKPNATSTKCICPAPMKWQNGKCTHVIQVICNPPQFIQGNKCVCPNNLQKVGNQCLPKIIPIQCNAPFVPNNSKTKCVCPFGTKYSGGTCIALNPQIICKAPFVPSNSGTKCVCPAGFRKSGGTCVPKVATISCNFPFVYSSRRNTCVCAKGYRLNNAGNKCIRKQAAPVVPRAVIREIQACLANLGYQPGPVDGAIGRRTRNAWADFRVDEGLTSRPNTFADAVTQDRLFVACARANQNAQPDPQPEPQPEPDTKETAPNTGFSTNFDPDKGYPELQCVSRALLPVFTGLMSDGEKPKICGEACVPIPSGMTASQIEQTGASVNWCRNCADLGNGNLVCTGNHVKDEEDGQN